MADGENAPLLCPRENGRAGLVWERKLGDNNMRRRLHRRTKSAGKLVKGEK